MLVVYPVAFPPVPFMPLLYLHLVPIQHGGMGSARYVFISEEDGESNPGKLMEELQLALSPPPSPQQVHGPWNTAPKYLELNPN